jgi:hypothetical protein
MARAAGVGAGGGLEDAVGVMKLISASMSWRFQASLKAARVSVVTGEEVEGEEGCAVTRELRK